MRRWISFFYTPFFVCTFLLIVKYYGLQIFVFQNASVLDWLLVAVPSILLLTIPVELSFKTRKREAFFILNALLSAAMVSVVVYFRQFGIVVTYHAFMQAHQVTDVGDSVVQLLQPVYLLFFADIIAYFVMRFFRVLPSFSHSFLPMKQMSAIWIACLATLVSFGYAYDHMLNELKQAERMGLVAYEVHTMFTGVRASAEAATVEPITPDSVRSVKDITLRSSPEHFGAAKGRNLIVVQLESVQNFLIGMRLGGEEITPTLNALLSDSYYFSNVYQQIGQGNTSDAEFMMNTSFYPPAQQAASQSYEKKVLPSLPRLLRERGYDTLTLHTNDVKFWNRNELYAALGFDRYYDKEYFGEEDIIAFGASDEVLYGKSMDVLKELYDKGTPYYAHIIAQSSHHPFLPPEGKEMIALPDEWENTGIGNYMKMVNYADRALGSFIENLKAQGMWEDTMLVVYGDHFGLSAHSLENEDKELIKKLLGHEYNLRTVHNIPFFITIPGVTDGGRLFDHLGGQVDFMPTIANLLGVSLKKHVHFGQDLLNYRENMLGSRFYLPTGSFLNDDIMYISGETFGEGTVIPLKPHDSIEETNPLLFKHDFVRVMRLLQMNDAYVESLPERK